ncbi:hypothetical protein CALVIDRAFT_528518 [Calocera viscosa TUFC12733]|uniref:Uncharacterized protein n=1 Tax=Calocera viscosa (strain TUFC12733) TaxID=1330018 RepID=A0A167KQ70_CALVF|nr:hypothetical protein CALVIDRAFT_528518 [Calocera viscosa TUFC12733]
MTSIVSIPDIPIVWSAVWLEKHAGCDGNIDAPEDVLRHISGVNTPGKTNDETPMKTALATMRFNAIAETMLDDTYQRFRDAGVKGIAADQAVRRNTVTTQIGNCAEVIIFLWYVQVHACLARAKQRCRIGRTLYEEKRRGRLGNLTVKLVTIRDAVLDKLLTELREDIKEQTAQTVFDRLSAFSMRPAGDGTRTLMRYSIWMDPCWRCKLWATALKEWAEVLEISLAFQYFNLKKGWSD